MKMCESCGRMINDFDIYTRNGFIQCEACAINNAPKSQPDADNNKEDKLKTANNILTYSADGWTRFMKTLTMIQLVILIIGSIVFSIVIGDNLDSFGLGFLAFILFTVISFALCGFTMVFLNMAENIAVIKSFVKKNYTDKENN